MATEWFDAPFSAGEWPVSEEQPAVATNMPDAANAIKVRMVQSPEKPGASRGKFKPPRRPPPLLPDHSGHRQGRHEQDDKAAEDEAVGDRGAADAGRPEDNLKTPQPAMARPRISTTILACSLRSDFFRSFEV